MRGLFWSIVLASGLWAQPKTVELDKLQEVAIRSSHRLKSKRLSQHAAHQELQYAKLYGLPDLTWSGSYTDYAKLSQVLTAVEPAPYQYYTFGADASWTIYDGAQGKKNVQIKEALLQVRQRELDEETLSLLNDINAAFFDAALAAQQIYNIEQRIELEEAKQAKLERLVEARKLKQLDILESQLQIQQSKRLLVDWESRYTKATNELSQLIHLQDSFWDNEIQFSMPIRAESVDRVVQAWILQKQSPRAQVIQSKLDKLRLEQDLARAERKPELELTGSYTQSDLETFSVESDGQAYSFGLEFSWSLTSSYKKKHEVLQLEYESLALQADYEETLSSEYQSKQDVLADLKAWREKQEHNALLVDLYRKRLELINKQVQAGVSQVLDRSKTELDLLDAKLKLDESRVEIARLVEQIYLQLQAAEEGAAK